MGRRRMRNFDIVHMEKGQDSRKLNSDRKTTYSENLDVVLYIRDPGFRFNRPH
jgi:hypothetical protein